MSIVLLTAPNPTSPSSISDYQYQNAYITATLQAFTGRAIVNGATIKAGTVIKIADVLYKSTTDTAITGTETPYVKITPSGASASASFVADLTGVSWSHAHGQYLDGSGNLHVFDEAKAIKDGELSVAFTMLGRISTLAGGLTINGSLDGVVALSAETVTSDSVESTSVSGGTVVSTGELHGKESAETISGTVNISNMLKNERRVVTWASAGFNALKTPNQSGALFAVLQTAGDAITGNRTLLAGNTQLINGNTLSVTLTIIRIF